MYKFSEWTNAQIDELIVYVESDLFRTHIKGAHKTFGHYYVPRINLVDDELVITLNKQFEYLPEVELEFDVAEYDDDSHDLICNVVQVYYKATTTLWEVNSGSANYDSILADIKYALTYINELDGIGYVLEDFIDKGD